MLVLQVQRSFPFHRVLRMLTALPALSLRMGVGSTEFYNAQPTNQGKMSTGTSWKTCRYIPLCIYPILPPKKFTPLFQVKPPPSTHTSKMARWIHILPGKPDVGGPNLDTLDIWDHTYLTSDQSSDGDAGHLLLTADASEMEMLNMMEGSSQSLQRVLCSPGSPDFWTMHSIWSSLSSGSFIWANLIRKAGWKTLAQAPSDVEDTVYSSCESSDSWRSSKLLRGSHIGQFAVRPNNL